MIKLALSDMDNTLVPFGAPRVSERTIAAIRACQEQGVDVGPASGRDRGELAGFFDGDASCYNTGVLVNGMKVYYLGELVREQTLDHDGLRAVERALAGRPGVAMVTYRANNFGDWVGASREEMGSLYDRVFMEGGHRWDVLPDYPVAKAGIVVLDGHEGALSRELGDVAPQFDFLNTVDRWLDVTPHGWSKVRGVRVLQQILGLAPEEVCVFGDADNDLTMLRAYPNSCAVANANEDAARAARWHVPASADDGVAWALEQIAEAARRCNETGEDVMPAFMHDGGRVSA